jgi:hypothetical protein
VLDPTAGRFEWPPKPSELRPLLEDQVAVFRRVAAWDRGARRQLADRKKLLTGPTTQRPTAAQLRARYGPNWGITSEGPEQAAARSGRLAHLIDRANRVALDRGGVTPGAIPVSHALRDVLTAQAFSAEVDAGSASENATSKAIQSAGLGP